jgi:hypothetical protein
MLPRLNISNRFTVELCNARARECLALTLEGGPRPARQMLEHIAASWSDLAAELKKTDAPGASSHAPHEGASPYDE